MSKGSELQDRLLFWEEQDRINKALVPRVLELFRSQTKLQEQLDSLATSLPRIESQLVARMKEDVSRRASRFERFLAETFKDQSAGDAGKYVLVIAGDSGEVRDRIAVDLKPVFESAASNEAQRVRDEMTTHVKKLSAEMKTVVNSVGVLSRDLSEKVQSTNNKLDKRINSLSAQQKKISEEFFQLADKLRQDFNYFAADNHKTIEQLRATDQSLQGQHNQVVNLMKSENAALKQDVTDLKSRFDETRRQFIIAIGALAMILAVLSVYFALRGV
jgi:hypothetical protein